MLKIVIAFPFSIFPVKTGGASRGYHLLKELVRHFDVIALVVDSNPEIGPSIKKEVGSEFHSLQVEHVKVCKGKRNFGSKVADRLKMLHLSRSPKKSANSSIIGVSRSLESILSNSNVDVAILTSQELSICGTTVRKYAPKALTIVDMHNVDHLLLREIQESSRDFEKNGKIYRRLRRAESRLSQYSDGVFACSPKDLEEILRLVSDGSYTGAVVPNGIDCDALTYDVSDKGPHLNTVIFCGTLSYTPNIDGLKWFYQEIWPIVRARNPNAKLVVVGSNLNKNVFQEMSGDQSIDLVGEVDNLEPYYHAAGISICPLRMGSGTRLKILEAMAFGNPVISTSKGSEGLHVENNKHLLLRESTNEFAEGVIELMSNGSRFDEIRQTARGFVEQDFDWKVIGVSMAGVIDHWKNRTS